MTGDARALVVRVVATVAGGYAFMVGTVALLGLALVQAGAVASEAVLGAAMFGFLFYVALILWGLAERRLARVLAVIIGGAVATITAAALMAPGAV